MAAKERLCIECDGKKECPACRTEESSEYWCRYCHRDVAEKRCPYCGLKAQKKKGGERT